MANKFKTASVDTMIGKHIGKRGSEKRETFESELRANETQVQITTHGYEKPVQAFFSFEGS